MRPYIRAANITWSGIDVSDVKEMNFDQTDFARFKLTAGDVLINEGSGSAKEVGKPAIWKSEIADCCFQNTVIRVQPRDCTSEYLYFYILYNARSGSFVEKTQGVNIYHIGKEGLATFPIPLPPLAEQRRIVARIEALFARTRRARADLERVRPLSAIFRQAIRAFSFGGEIVLSSEDYGRADAITHLKELPKLPEHWKWKKISDFAHVQTGATPLRSEKNFYENGKIPWVTSSCVNYDMIPQASEFITEKAIKETNCKIVPAGTLVIALYGEGKTRGKASILGIDAATNQALAAIVLDSPSPELTLWLREFFALRYRQMRSMSSGGVQPNLNLGIIKSTLVPIPPPDLLPELLRYIRRNLSSVDVAEANATRALALLDHLEKSILTRAFRGELVPQDPNDEPAEAALARARPAPAQAKPRGRRARQPA